MSARIALDPEAAKLLETLAWYGPHTRQALSSRLGLSRARLASLLEALKEASWLIEETETASTGGRRAREVTLNPDAGYLLGVTLEDEEGTVTLADAALTPLTSSSCHYSLHDGPGKVMAAVTEMIRSALDIHETPNLLAVGVSVPSPVERTTGLLVNPSKPGWEGFSLRQHLEEIIHAPIHVDNDANMLALGALWQARREGSAMGNEHWLVVKLSSAGIGAGIIAAGQLYRGVGGGVGELGHIQVDPEGPRCNCGYRGCLETVAAAPAVLRQATKAAEAGESPRLKDRLNTHGALGISDLAQIAREGDEVANALLLGAGANIGGVLGALVNVLNPSSILLGGAFAYVGPLMLASVRQAIYGRALPLMSRQIGIDYMRSDTAGMSGVLVQALVETVRQK